MINILIVTYSIIAAIIGAGFASGQEMLLYFVCFKKYGLIGIFVTVTAFMIFIYAILSVCIKHNHNEYNDFLSIFKSYNIRRIINVITLIFSFAVYSAMISATGEMLFDFFGIHRASGTLLCVLFATLLFSLCGEKVFTFNAVLCIVLVFLITFSALYMLSYREFHTFSNQVIPAINNGLIYSGYNLVSLTPVLVALSKKLNSKSDAVAVSLSVGTASFIIMTLIFGLISIYAGKINLGELPMLTLARRQNPTFATLYAVVLSSAIITTLISSGGGLCNALNIRKKPQYIALLSMFAYFIAGLGFSNLINIAYRLCGILGLFVCVLIIYTCFSHKKMK